MEGLVILLLAVNIIQNYIVWYQQSRIRELTIAINVAIIALGKVVQNDK